MNDKASDSQTQKINSSLPLKSVAGALLFSIFLGPIGLLYATTMGGTIMIVLGFIIACYQYPIPIILVWLGSCIWSVAATNRYNRDIIRCTKK